MFINSTYKHPLNSGCGPRTPTNPHFNHKIVWGTHVNLLQTLNEVTLKHSFCSTSGKNNLILVQEALILQPCCACNYDG